MKKKLFFISFGVVIVLAALYLIRYKQAVVFENKIPKVATAIIHINARQIEHHILIDVMKNPLKYVNFKVSKKNKDTLQLKKTISIPRNLFFFTNVLAFKNGWFSSFLKVKNKIKLRQYLVKEGFIQSIDHTITLFNKGNILLAMQDERLLVVYRKNKETITLAVLKTIFDEVDFLSEQTDLLKPIVNSTSDMSYTTTTRDFLEANFKDGLFELLGTLNSELFLVSKQNDFTENSEGYINAKINKKHKLFQTLIAEENTRKFNELTKLSLDSIISKWNGDFAFNLKSINSKIDTIVTYDYDDDFNKIEKMAVQELIVPDLDFSYGIDSNLFGYLSRKNAIQVIESDTVFTSMPLYKLYASTNAAALNISTQKDFSGFSIKENKMRLNAYFNIEKYIHKPLEFSFLPTKNSYLQLLKETTIMYTVDSKLSITVVLKNSERNFIGQFVSLN